MESVWNYVGEVGPQLSQLWLLLYAVVSAVLTNLSKGSEWRGENESAKKNKLPSVFAKAQCAATMGRRCKDSNGGFPIIQRALTLPVAFC